MFRFKQFAIEQDRTAMKVGTDGVLLGAWVSLRGDEGRILDIGTGTGVIALMLAQRSGSRVDGVEIDPDGAEQARENVDMSPWADRVAIYCSDIQSYVCDDGGYDLIVSNPPYFVSSMLSPSVQRTTARHTTDLSFRDLGEAVVRLLNPNGRFALILPPAEMQLFEREVSERLFVVRRCDVYSRVGVAIKRLLCEFSLTPPEVEPLHETLIIEGETHLQYTDEYRDLTRDFYLKF